MIPELRLTVENPAEWRDRPEDLGNARLLLHLCQPIRRGERAGAAEQPDPLVARAGHSPLRARAASSQTPRINRKRIYRSQTSATGATDLYLIGEIDNNTGIFDDVPDTTPLQEPIPRWTTTCRPTTCRARDHAERDRWPHSSAARSISARPYRPHARPQKYPLKTDFSIVGLATAGATLVVMTKGCPHRQGTPTTCAWSASR